MDQHDIYQKKLKKYKYKYALNKNEIYNDKINLYSNLCVKSCCDIFNNLKFYYGILKFLDMNIIKYISEFNKITDRNYQSIFDNIKSQLGFANLNVRYIDKYSHVKDFSSKDNIDQIIMDLSDKNKWSIVLSKLILWKILYLYEFNEKLYPKIKEFCQNKIVNTLELQQFYI
jgi:2,3-bisphosphoglycerate-independent phosphoglycerate mutase